VISPFASPAGMSQASMSAVEAPSLSKAVPRTT
jgi:hypothetical protein